MNKKFKIYISKLIINYERDNYFNVVEKASNPSSFIELLLKIKKKLSQKYI